MASCRYSPPATGTPSVSAGSSRSPNRRRLLPAAGPGEGGLTSRVRQHQEPFMRVRVRLVEVAVIVAFGTAPALAQQDDAAGDRFVASEVMIPMRDGVRLHTRLFVPKDQDAPLPFILVRTPY